MKTNHSRKEIRVLLDTRWTLYFLLLLLLFSSSPSSPLYLHSSHTPDDIASHFWEEMEAFKDEIL